MPPDLVLLSTLSGSNYPCLELNFMAQKVFQPLKFDCICTLDKPDEGYSQFGYCVYVGVQGKILCRRRVYQYTLQ